MHGNAPPPVPPSGYAFWVPFFFVRWDPWVPGSSVDAGSGGCKNPNPDPYAAVCLAKTAGSAPLPREIGPENRAENT